MSMLYLNAVSNVPFIIYLCVSTNLYQILESFCLSVFLPLYYLHVLLLLFLSPFYLTYFASLAAKYAYRHPFIA